MSSTVGRKDVFLTKKGPMNSSSISILGDPFTFKSWLPENMERLGSDPRHNKCGWTSSVGLHLYKQVWNITIWMKHSLADVFLLNLFGGGVFRATVMNTIWVRHLINLIHFSDLDTISMRIGIFLEKC